MNRESLSALLDGECKTGELDQLLAELDRTPALRSEWSRLCIARESLQGKARRTDEALVRNVMAAIAREAAAPAPRPVRAISWAWLRPVAGYALAASVGAVTVFSLLPNTNRDSSAAGTQSEVAAAADPQLNSYVLDHSAYRAQQGLGGALGYARFGAYNAVYRPQASGN